MQQCDLSYKSDEELYDLQNRATGRSARIIDNLIQEFFTQPMGTKIFVHDHYPSRRSDLFLGDRMAGRLKNEFNVKFKYNKNTAQGPYFVREEPTYHELVMEEIEKREAKNGKLKRKPKVLKYSLKHR
jgi:hypothetical protein